MSFAARWLLLLLKGAMNSAREMELCKSHKNKKPAENGGLSKLFVFGYSVRIHCRRRHRHHRQVH